MMRSTGCGRSRVKASFASAASYRSLTSNAPRIVCTMLAMCRLSSTTSTFNLASERYTADVYAALRSI
jgi:hypothetical protein